MMTDDEITEKWIRTAKGNRIFRSWCIESGDFEGNAIGA